jgi:ABC-2 type transport system permease protein
LTAVGVLLAFWMLGFLLAPRVLGDLVAKWTPPPTRFEFQMAMQADLDQRSEVQARLAAEEQRLADEFGSGDSKDWLVNFRAVRLQLGEEHGQRVADVHYGNLFDLFEAQNDALARWSWIFPALAVRQISMSMAGTDLRHFRDFLEQGEGYRRTIQRLMNDDLYLNPEEDGKPYLAGRELWEQLPPWEFEPVSWTDSMTGLGGSACVLVGWNLVLPWLGWMATGRMFRRI